MSFSRSAQRAPEVPSEKRGLWPADRRSFAKSILVLAVVATALVYLPSVGFGFLHDDETQIRDNPLIRSWSNIPYFFTHHIWVQLNPLRYGSYYRPLFMAVLITVGKIFGIHPWGYRLVGVLLFLVVVGGVYLLARELELAPVAAASAVLLFAVHPAHNEVVAWISGMTETLVAIPLLLALCFYLRAWRRKSWAWFAACLGAYACALLTKETAVVFPVLVLGMEFLGLNSERLPGSENEKLPRSQHLLVALRIGALSAVTGIYLLARAAFIGVVAKDITFVSWGTVLLTIPQVCVIYLRHLLLPLNLSLFYDTYYVFSWRAAEFLLPAALLLAILALLIVSRQRQWLTPVETFSVFAVFACLAPVLDFRVFQWREIVHDRYLFLSSIFLAIFLGSLLIRLLPVRLATAILMAAFVFLMAETELQMWQYRNAGSLFSHAVEVAPNNAGALNGLADLLLDEGKRADAKLVMHRLVLVAPNWWDYQVELGQLEFEDGNYAAAEKLFRRAIELRPEPGQQHNYLAQILKQEGREAEAEQEMQRYLHAPDTPRSSLPGNQSSR